MIEIMSVICPEDYLENLSNDLLGGCSCGVMPIVLSETSHTAIIIIFHS